VPLLPYTQQRVRSFLTEIERLSESEFPYMDSKAALDQLRTLFDRKLQRLEAFAPGSDPSIISQECRVTLLALYQYLPLLGFILRSTNVRNAFEAFGPFLRLAGDVLEPGIERGQRKTKLLLSSEWDYSPFTYPTIPDLPKFLFIGLPAPESANPLLIPLAGHELGHAVWSRYSLRQIFQASAQDEVVKVIQADWAQYQQVFPNSKITPADLTTNLFAVETWRVALEWCLYQAEETFCDFLGLRIFGASYLHAFGYLLSPGFGSRSVRYPAMQARVPHLLAAASVFGVVAPAGFSALFENDTVTTASQADEYRIQVADQALEQLIGALTKAADDRVTAAAIPSSSTDQIERVLSRIKQVVPAENCKTVADILNAGWAAHGDENLWNESPAIKARKDQVLKELILKNFEIFEIERILQEQ
jgi:hypothetical protein